MNAFFDSHCHLDFEVFASDREAVLARAAAAGVAELFVPGVSPRNWAALGALRQRHAELSIGLGLHPQFIAQLSAAELEQALAELEDVARALGAVAIGECGLDGRESHKPEFNIAQQEATFRAQLEIAHKLELPPVLHIVGLHGRALALLREHAPYAHGGMVHSYSGSVELVRDYVALGFSLGFGGAITRPRAARARAALAAVPAERLLLETDAPDQAPEGTVGRNEPAFLPLIAAVAAKVRGEPVDQIAAQTRQNARVLFRS